MDLASGSECGFAIDVGWKVLVMAVLSWVLLWSPENDEGDGGGHGRGRSYV